MRIEVEALTVGELRGILKDFPDDLPVILQRDSEGNGYSPAEGAEEAAYVPETACSGECYEPKDAGAMTRAVRCVVLWPVS